VRLPAPLRHRFDPVAAWYNKGVEGLRAFGVFPLFTEPHILLLDIETSPLLGYAWGVYEQNIFNVIKHSHILSFAYQWYPDTRIKVVSLRQFKGYAHNKNDDRHLVEELWKLMDKADIVVAQNGDAFDIKKINTRFLFHRMELPSPYTTVDTLKISRRVFGHPSNKLDDVCQYHGIGRKLPHTGKDLWFGCMAGNERDWRVMEKYNAHDVYLLRKLYDLVRPWAKTHPNVNIISRKPGACRVCGGTRLHQRGYRYTRTTQAPRLQCQDCSAWMVGEHEPTKKIQIR